MATKWSDEQLVDFLGDVWASMVELGETLSEDEWKRSTEVPGWSVQDNLDHITGLEWRLLGRPDPDHSIPDDLEHVKNDFGKMNEIWVDSRRGYSGADAFAEFREVTDARIAQLRSFGPDDFAQDSFTPAGPGTVRDLLPFRIFDSWVHEQDMRRAVAKPGDLDSPVAAAALERVIDALPFVVGKKAGAPDGTSVVFELRGPLAQNVAIAVENGRAKVVDQAPTDADVRIVTDTETIARLGCGRIDPGPTLDGGHVTIEGDAALGRRIVVESNFLF